MTIKVEAIDQHSVTLRLSGTMDGHDGHKFKECILELLASEHHCFVINLEELIWINSSGCGYLVAGLCTVKHNGGVTVLVGAGGRTKRALEIIQLHKFYLFRRDMRDAVRELNRHGMNDPREQTGSLGEHRPPDVPS